MSATLHTVLVKNGRYWDITPQRSDTMNATIVLEERVTTEQVGETLDERFEKSVDDGNPLEVCAFSTIFNFKKDPIGFEFFKTFA